MWRYTTYRLLTVFFMMVIWVYTADSFAATPPMNNELVLELRSDNENPLAGVSFWLEIFIPDEFPVSGLYGISMEVQISNESGSAVFESGAPEPGTFWDAGDLLTFHEYSRSTLVDFSITRSDQLSNNGSGPVARIPILAESSGEVLFEIIRITAVDNLGDELSVNASSLLLEIESPPEPLQAPVLISPTNNRTNVLFFTQFLWSGVPKAETYTLQIFEVSNPDVVFREVVVSDTSVVVELEEYTRYRWRIKSSATDSTDSEWSASFEFTTLILPPQIVFPENDTNGISTAPYIVWAREKVGLSVQLQVSLFNNFSTVVLSEVIESGDRSRVTGLNAAQTYYVRIRYFDPSNSIVSDFANAVFRTREVQPAVSITSINYNPPQSQTGRSTVDYRMIGFPVSNAFTNNSLDIGRAPRDYRLFRDTGINLEELAPGDEWDFERGQGFWIVARNNFTLNLNYATPPSDANDTFTIPLHPGWNIISSPFNRDIEWSQVQKLNGIDWLLYGFDGSYSTQTVLMPGFGYYVFNTTSTTFNLQIPLGVVIQSIEGIDDGLTTGILSDIMFRSTQSGYSTHQSPVFLLGLPDNNEFKLPDEQYYHTYVISGYHPSQNIAVHHPPPHFSRVNLAIAPNSDIVNTRADALNLIPRAYKKVALRSETESVDFNVRERIYLANKFNELLELLCFELTGENHTPAQCALIHQDTGKRFDAFDGVISGPFPEGYYGWYAGSHDSIEEAAQAYIPEQVTLLSAYPNPFNSSTVIPFRLSESAYVRLKIYDSLGRVVETLANELLKPGYHSYRFNAANLSSGLYFYQLDADGGQYTRKMMLVK